jgi:hypothetical protein
MRRALPILVAALAGCTTAFPEYRGGDGAPGAEAGPPGAEAGPPGAEAGPSPTDTGTSRIDARGTDTSPADARVPDAAPADARVPDAAPRDALAPDAAPSVMLASDDPAPPGCAPRDVTLTWHATGVQACHLASDPPGATPLAAVLPDGATTVHLAADTRFSLTCDGPDGALESDVAVAFVTGLPDQRAFATREAVRAEQRRCAGVRGLTALDDDSEVHADDDSAVEVCRCAGYAAVAASDRGVPCFASPGDNWLGYWLAAENRWNVREAWRDNRCLQALTCAQPAQRCADLYAP